MSATRHCGSQYGYRKHLKLGTKVCKRCRLAMNEVNAKSRAKNHDKELERHRQYHEREKTGESLPEYRARLAKGKK